MRPLRGQVGRLMVRSAGQIVVSVLTTLVATTIYSGLRDDLVPAAGRPAPADVTSGGKFAARVEGGAASPFESMAPLPILSIVNWVPPSTEGTGWKTGHDMLPPATRPARPLRVVRRAQPIIAVQPPVMPLGLRADGPEPATVGSMPLWSAASGIAGSAATTLGQAGGSLVSAARAMAASGGSLLVRLMP